ncbi:F-box domain-containing protein [Pleurotus pulmonarius]
MRSLNRLPLDDDLVDRVFVFLPTFDALQAFLLTSKSIYQVYLRYPESIVRSVAYNVAGPALPQAMHLVEYKIKLEDARNQDNETKSVDLPEESSTVKHISTKAAHQLARIAKVATELEDLFSRIHKDRCSRTSTLTSLESWRFRCAVYRIMLFSAHFGPMFAYLEDDEMDSDASTEKNEELLQQCVAFLDGMLDPELLETWAVMLFLSELVNYTEVVGHSEPGEVSSGFALMIGPEAILESVRSRSTAPLQEADIYTSDNVPTTLSQGFLREPLTTLLQKRRTHIPPSHQVWGALLHEIKGENDQCERCQSVCGMSLFNEHNWDLLQGTIRPNEVAALLKGRLRFAESGFDLLNRLNTNTTIDEIISEIFDEIKFAEDTTERTHWLCYPCLREFVSGYLHHWLRESRRKEGKVIHEDCWYGYNCRTQVHNRAHANKLNHLCDPTRGDT